MSVLERVDCTYNNACINTYLYAKFKNNLSGKVCKIDKPSSLSIKTFKNMNPRKDGKWNIFSNLKYLQLIKTILKF